MTRTVIKPRFELDEILWTMAPQYMHVHPRLGVWANQKNSKRSKAELLFIVIYIQGAFIMHLKAV